MAAYRTVTGAAVYLPESVPIDLPDLYDEGSPPRQALPDKVLAAMRQGHAVERLEPRGSAAGGASLLRGFVLAVLVLCLVGGLVLRAARPAAAQHPFPCVAPAALAKRLANEYNEAPIALGVLGNGHLLEVYHSEAKGTWTVVITIPNPPPIRSCVIASGNGFEILPVGQVM